MRAVIQRVTEASVTTGGKVFSGIQEGLLVLLGIELGDGPGDARSLCQKILNLRIFSDPSGVMNRSVLEEGKSILLVSQFTLLGSTLKGNRPSYSRSAGREEALPLYQLVGTLLEEGLGRPVPQGIFGEDMQVALVNDGPVTILLDSRNPL